MLFLDPFIGFKKLIILFYYKSEVCLKRTEIKPKRPRLAQKPFILMKMVYVREIEREKSISETIISDENKRLS